MAVTISVSDKFESTRFMLYWYEIEVLPQRVQIPPCMGSYLSVRLMLSMCVNITS